MTDAHNATITTMKGINLELEEGKYKSLVGSVTVTINTDGEVYAFGAGDMDNLRAIALLSLAKHKLMTPS